MAADVVLDCRQVSKKFCRNLKRSLLYGATDIGRQVLRLPQHPDSLRRHEFWALHQVDFQLRRGERLGIVGPNGAGKSTLLKMLNGVLRPDTGEIRLYEPITALIELGSGFNPLLTGRENIRVNAAMLGLAPREVEARLPEIVDFAELGDFIDTPLKNYSSGMVSRLAFSVVTVLRPRILVLDEIFAVGDAAFLRKAAGRMTELLRSGITLIYVSHSMWTLQQFCERALFLDHGRVLFDGPTEQAISAYYNACVLPRLSEAELPLMQRARLASPETLTVRELEVKLRTEPTSGASELHEIRLELDARVPLHDIQIVSKLFTEDRIALGSLKCQEPVSGGPGRVALTTSLRGPRLKPGTYTLGLYLSDSRGLPLFLADEAAFFQITWAKELFASSGSRDGFVLFEADWRRQA